MHASICLDEPERLILVSVPYDINPLVVLCCPTVATCTNNCLYDTTTTTIVVARRLTNYNILLFIEYYTDHTGRGTGRM